MPQIPTHVTNYNVFREGRRLIGMANVTLMNAANLTDALKGAGLMGEIDHPVQCHFQAMGLTLNWHVVTEDAVYLFEQDGLNLDLWAAHQYHDGSTNQILHHGWRYNVMTVPKGLNFGNLEVGVKGEAVSEFEIWYLRAWYNDREVVEADKINFFCRVNGNDYASRVRQLIGM
jgi:uncharacterized protein